MSLDSQPNAGSEVGGEAGWREKYPDIYSSGPPPDTPSAAASISLEGTVQVVKEKMWLVGDAALKTVAEVLYGFGISPTVLGYTEEELMEEEEGYEAGVPAVRRDEVVAKTSFALHSEERLQRRKAEDSSKGDDDVADDPYAAEPDDWQDDYAAFGEDKKDK